MELTPTTSRRTGRRLLLIAGIAIVMVVLVMVFAPRGLEDDAPSPPAAARTPIATEADVFRTDIGALAIAADAEARPGTRGRSLAAVRRLRAYPGAPPTVPHEVSAQEQLTQACNACHGRGGYAPRFGAYAPITPHPELANCLQCHVAQATDGVFAATDWRTIAWPTLGQAAFEGGPPAIPHDLPMRGNCVACHVGPGAVAEIRTTHPERANCRQCHVPVLTQDEFIRPLDGSRGGRSPQ